MERARVAVIAALFVVVSISGAVAAATGGAPSGPMALAAVAWPPSTLLVSELQTGGASASDEFVEITNVGSSSIDLAGLEVVYVTSTGGTITRKASWAAPQLLAPGRHLLIANTSGIFAGLADLTYSGGFAATGGAVVLRTIGGAPIDSLGWGDATNAFVEGTAASAPVASSSLERRPGGLAGNTIDTNSNAADWFGQASPNPQALSAPPVPAPGPSPTPTATPTAAPSPSASPTPTPVPTATPTPMPTVLPSATPTATDSPTPTPIPSDIASPDPTATAAPTATPAPTIEPTPLPTPSPSPVPTDPPAPTPTAAPTPTPTPSATPTPTPMATPAPTATPVAPITIASARALADGSSVTILGVLTMKLGALEAGRTAFIQDDTGGIALYLDAVPVDFLPAGTVIQASGIVDDRYAQRTLRVQLTDVIGLGAAPLPAPVIVPTGAVGEPIEGSRVEVSGVTTGSPTAYADGLGILVDDGTGPVRVILGPAALGGASLPAGTLVTIIGPAGQHDSSGTGAAGYRIHSTEPGELVVLPQPTPSPSPAPSASPSPSPAPTPSPTAGPTATPSSTPSSSPIPTPTPVPTASPTPMPTPSPTPQPGTVAIHDARRQTVGKSVTVAGIVTAEAGRLGTPSLMAIQDSTGGIVVKIPDGVAAPIRGIGVIVTGPIANPYGQLEIRPAAGGIRLTGLGTLPSPADVVATELGEGTEGILVDVVGVASRPPSKGTSGDLSFAFADASGHAFRVMADGSSGVGATTVPIGRQLRITGVAGQRASRKGVLDGYRIWIRDRADVVVVSGPGPTPSGAPTISIAAALAKADGAPVRIEATVTAGTSLLDSSGRRIVLQDGTGAIEVLLPVGSAGPAVGSVIRIAGAMAHAWGAPRLRAETVEDRHAIVQVQPVTRGAALGQLDEWRLVRISGTITKVERFGDRWRAEVALAGSKVARVPILGQAGAGIPSTRLAEGATVTVTGIVKRPYPTATDRRFAVLPRSGADLATSAPAGSGGSGGGGSNASNGGGGGGAGRPDATAGVVDVTPDTDLAALRDHLGAQVRVGGLVAAVSTDGVDLDDGSATARLVFRGDAVELLPYLRTGDAIAATGRVEQLDGANVVIVDGAAGVVRVGDLGQALPVVVAGASPAGGSAQPSEPRLTAAGGLVDGPATWSIAAMGGLSILSLVVTLIRRRRAQRRFRAVIVARLATLKPSGGRT
ncbi:MAG TPA: lamin tail domain-containing protein [Candidatus Limnocylindrales bacterium]|nr:lamin tail domain-containing protein [Candidatus Limnocylindrales bacterium]